jgi:hypothetical protein
VSGAAENKLTLPCEITGAETKELFAVGKFGDMAGAFAREEVPFSLNGEVFTLTKGLLMGVPFSFIFS